MVKYDFEIIPCKGLENGCVDALSCREDYFELMPKLTSLMFGETAEGYYELVAIDTLFTIEDGNPILDKIKDEVSNWTPEQFPEDVTLAEGLLYRNERIWVLEPLQQEVTKTVYEHLLHGHKGVIKTLQ